MKNENNCCDQCQQDFDRNIDRMVNEVDGYTEQDCLDKRSEVEKAFEGREEGGAGRENRENREGYGRGEHNELDRRHEQQGYTEQREVGDRHGYTEQHRHDEHRHDEHRHDEQHPHGELYGQYEHREHGVKNEWDEQRERREQPAEHRH